MAVIVKSNRPINTRTCAPYVLWNDPPNINLLKPHAGKLLLCDYCDKPEFQHPGGHCLYGFSKFKPLGETIVWQRPGDYRYNEDAMVHIYREMQRALVIDTFELWKQLNYGQT